MSLWVLLRIGLLMLTSPGLFGIEQVHKSTTGWTYQRSASVTGAVEKASVRSTTRLDMGYPHGKDAFATLTLRRRAGESSIYLELSKGYFNHSYLNGTARVRFDGQPPRRYPLQAAANGRANIVFLDVDKSFLPLLRRARQLDVAWQFAGHPTRRVSFPVAGLQWPH